MEWPGPSPRQCQGHAVIVGGQWTLLSKRPLWDSAKASKAALVSIEALTERLEMPTRIC